MRACIAHRIDGRSRFVYEENLSNEYINNLKYLIESVEGVKTCRVYPLANSFTVSYEEGSLPRLAKFILGLDMREVRELVIDDSNFYPQADEDLFHIIRDALLKRFFLSLIHISEPTRPLF